MKKVVAILLVAVMALSTLFGCGGSSNDSTTTAAATEKESEQKTEAAEKTTEAATEAESADEGGDDEGGDEGEAILPDDMTYKSLIKGAPSLYPNVDFSKEETIYITLIGDTPNDFKDIVDAANEYLKPFNTKLDFNIWAWSDYKKLYSLNLAAGENIDLIFTAPWSFMWSEASNGSFRVLTEDFLAENMPLTTKYQKPETWNGVKLDGNIVAVPSNDTSPNGKIIAVRQDLVEKYGRTELKDWNDYKEWLIDIATKETPQSGIMGIGAATDNEQVWNVYREQFGTMEAVVSQDRVTYYFVYEEGKLPKAEDLVFAWDNDWFKAYCKDMVELAQAGAWSRSALTNETRPQDAFGALQAASFARNTVLTYMEQAEEADPNARCQIYDITQDYFCLGEAYNNNDIAITSSSKNPERAAMVLDLMKFDTYLNHLFRMGIEGVHYTLDDDNNYIQTDKSGDYPKDTLAISWIIRNGEVTEYIEDDRQRWLDEEERAKMVANPLEGFVFNDSNIQFEAQACNTILQEYIPSLQLGLFDDYEEKIDQMMAELDKAGFQKVDEEIRSQYAAWYESMQ